MKWQHLIQLNLAVLLFLLASGCSAYTRKKGRLDESGYVGLRLKTEGAYVRIIGVTVGSPGDKSGGLQPGMIILGIAENRTNSKIASIRGRSIDEVSRLVSGAPGSTIVFEVSTLGFNGVPEINLVQVTRGATGGLDWRTEPFISRYIKSVTYDTNLVYQLFGGVESFDKCCDREDVK